MFDDLLYTVHSVSLAVSVVLLILAVSVLLPSSESVSTDRIQHHNGKLEVKRFFF